MPACFIYITPGNGILEVGTRPSRISRTLTAKIPYPGVMYMNSSNTSFPQKSLCPLEKTYGVIYNQYHVSIFKKERGKYR